MMDLTSNASVFEQIEFLALQIPIKFISMGAVYHIYPASSILHIFSCDAECLVINKGDLFRFSHDVILAGIGAGARC